MIAPIITARQLRGGDRVAASGRCAAVTLAEVLATSDLPGGVVNILTGDPAEIAPHLAAHGDVNALDLTGADGELRTELERAAAGTVKRVYAPAGTRLHRGRPAPPGCGRSWRSRPSGTRPARCRWPAAEAGLTTRDRQPREHRHLATDDMSTLPADSLPTGARAPPMQSHASSRSAGASRAHVTPVATSDQEGAPAPAGTLEGLTRPEESHSHVRAAARRRRRRRTRRHLRRRHPDARATRTSPSTSSTGCPRRTA